MQFCALACRRHPARRAVVLPRPVRNGPRPVFCVLLSLVLAACGASLEDEIDFPVLQRYEAAAKQKEQQAFLQKRQGQYAEVAGLFQRAGAVTDPDTKILTYLRAGQLIREMWAEQADARLSELHDAVRRAILAVPPPARFTDPDGRDLVLAGTGRDAVYLSITAAAAAAVRAFQAQRQAPQPADTGVAASAATAISRSTAVAFCEWLSAQHGRLYGLPTVAVLQHAGIAFPCALWTATEWTGPDATGARMRRQFGARMYTLWDPQERLGSGTMPGEFPFAAHTQLGFTVTVAPAAGIQDRLNRLQRQLVE